MPQDIFIRVEQWYCNGLPTTGLTAAERSEVITSAQGSYLAEHVARTEEELKAMDDQALVATHYSAMADAAR